MKRHAVALIALAGALVASALVVPSGSAQAVERAAGDRVVSREIGFRVVNGTASLLGCLPASDGREHVVRARLVGPARVVEGRAGSTTMQLLVHDAGTGGWFWNLHGKGVGRAQNYARQLAERGQTVVVLDRLGYDRSPLPGGATCLNAQVSMLSAIVEHLYAGLYDVRGAGPDAATPHASHVVLHGHGTGATIARLEAARHDNVQALVLMSPTTSSPSALARQTVQGQAAACLRGARFAPYGSAATYRRLLFASASAAVQRAATRQRNSTPCGDVASLLPAVLAARGQAVTVPTLVLRGAADARERGDDVTAARGTRLVRRTFAGAGSALPLERQAPAVRRAVLGFVRSLDDRRH